MGPRQRPCGPRRLRSTIASGMFGEDEDEDDYKIIRVGNLVDEHGLEEEQAEEVMFAAYRLHDHETQKSDSADQLRRAIRTESKVLQMHNFMQRVSLDTVPAEEEPVVRQLPPSTGFDVDLFALCSCSPR